MRFGSRADVGRCLFSKAPSHALCWPFIATLVATLATADPILHQREELLAGDKHDDTITQLIKSMRLCFLSKDIQEHPPGFRWGWGMLYVQELCCSGTFVDGLGMNMQPEWQAENGDSGDKSWQGDATLSLRLQTMETTCQAHWHWVPDHWVPTPLGNNHSGNVTLKLETGPPDPVPFVEMSIQIDGKPVISEGITYPFPGQVSVLGCSTDFRIAQISFDGWAARLLNLTSYVTPKLLNVLQPLVCHWVKSKVPTVVTGALDKLHSAAVELIDQTPVPLNMPTAPVGSGPAMNLQDSRQLDFVKGLLEQGLNTGELGRLIDRATAGTGIANLKLGSEGVQLAEIGIEKPTALDLKLFVEAGGVQGMHKIDHVGLQVSNTSSLRARLAQAAVTASVFFRTESAIPAAAGLTQFHENTLNSEIPAEQTIEHLLWRVLETLTERFSMSLSLSQLDASMELGLLVDEERLRYLAKGQSWYNGDCLNSMVQNISVLDVGLNVVTENFKWTSAIKNPGELEVEFVAGVNSVLDYLDVPGMRPTISRLVKSLAADRVRNVMNDLLAAWLAAPPKQPCRAKFGVGSHLLFSILALVGCVAVLAAAFSLAWWQSSRRPLNLERVAFLLAVAGFFLLGGGLLGYPFRAAVRLHNGNAADSLAGDSLVNMFVVDLGDPWGPLPGVVTITTMQCLLGASRLVLLMTAVKLSFRRHLASGIRVLAAIGAWDLGVVYYFAGTQVASFYTLIVKFGGSFADMGVQINLGFYLHAFGFYLCDAATILVYRRCIRPKQEGTVNVSCQMPMNRRRFALLGLVLGLILLLAAPWLTLWKHSYGGVLGKAFHFQSNTTEQALTLAAIIARQSEVLNPGPAGLGPFALRFFLLMHVILAPIAHAVLALCVGLKLRGRSPDAREGASQANASHANASTPSMLSSGQSVGDEPTLPVWTQQVLVLARMWAGADAFSVTMWVVVPELGRQLVMMSAQGCDPLAPLLDRLGSHCNVAATDLAAPGLPVLFMGGLLVRISAELYAHGPLRSLQQRGRAQRTETASDVFHSIQDVQMCGQTAGPAA